MYDALPAISFPSGSRCPACARNLDWSCTRPTVLRQSRSMRAHPNPFSFSDILPHPVREIGRAKAFSRPSRWRQNSLLLGGADPIDPKCPVRSEWWIGCLAGCKVFVIRTLSTLGGEIAGIPWGRRAISRPSFLSLGRIESLRVKQPPVVLRIKEAAEESRVRSCGSREIEALLGRSDIRFRKYKYA